MFRTTSLSLIVWFSIAGLLPADGFKEVGLDFQRSNPQFLRVFSNLNTRLGPALVRVNAAGQPVALGAIVDADGWILTKAHDLKEPLTCRLFDGRVLPAKLIRQNEEHDLALLKIEAARLPTVAWSSAKDLAPGQWVVAVSLGGQPAGVGVVSVGIREIPEKTRRLTAQAYLGVAIEKESRGLRVTQVVPETAAQKAGLLVDDLLIGFAGKDLLEGDDLSNFLADRRPGEVIALQVLRSAQKLEIHARLGQRPQVHRSDFQNRLGSAISNRTAGYPVFFQHDAVVHPTECGGPLVDLEGRVIGLNISRAGRTETWAIPGDVVERILKDLRQEPTVAVETVGGR